MSYNGRYKNFVPEICTLRQQGKTIRAIGDIMDARYPDMQPRLTMGDIRYIVGAEGVVADTEFYYQRLPEIIKIGSAFVAAVQGGKSRVDAAAEIGLHKSVLRNYETIFRRWQASFVETDDLFGLSTRVETALKTEGITRLDDLAQRTPTELARIVNIARRGVREIQSFLADQGMALAEETPIASPDPAPMRQPEMLDDGAQLVPSYRGRYRFALPAIDRLRRQAAHPRAIAAELARRHKAEEIPSIHMIQHLIRRLEQEAGPGS